MHIFFTMVSPETSSRVFVFACFILLQTGPLIQALRSECMVDRQGTSALVTCIFDTDVSKLPNDFQVDRIRADDAISNQVWSAVHSGDTSNSFKTELGRAYASLVEVISNNNDFYSSETVFLCHKSQGKFEYTQRPGYMLIGTVSTNVTLRISNVTQAYAEKYLCAVIPSDPSEVRLCELKLKETVAETDDTTDQITDSPARTVKNKESASIDLPIVIGLSVAIPLLIAFLVTLFCIIYRKRNARKGSQSEEQPFNDPESPSDSTKDIAND